jgi:hypothetical protein
MTNLRTTTKSFLRWKTFNGKLAPASSITLRSGKSGRMVKLPSTLASHVDGAVNLDTSAAVAPPERCADDHEYDHSNRRQQALAFGVRMIF